MNFPVSCFSAQYIHGLILRISKNFRMKSFLTTLFRGHEATFSSNKNVPLYSSSEWISDYRTSFHRKTFQALNFITFRITYLHFLSLPHITCIQIYMHTKETTRNCSTDTTTTLNKDEKAKILKMLNRRMFGKQLLLRYNTETEPHILAP